MLIGRKVRDIVRMDGISSLACRSIAYAYREMMDRIWKQTRAARAYRGVMDRIWKQARAARATERGYKSNFIWPSATVKPAGATHLNALHKFFDNRKQGPGIWKRNHYFDIYDCISIFMTATFVNFGDRKVTFSKLAYIAAEV